MPYAFYISDEELVEQLGIYLQKKKCKFLFSRKVSRRCMLEFISRGCFLDIIVSVERTLQIVYQPQALFRIRPVNRCSATIAGK